MRADYYYFLTSTFGDVPFYTEDVSDLEALNRVSRLGRMPADATREYLINELLDIVPKMKQERTFEADKHRSGAAMGWMLIAKMAAWNKQWEVVRDACLELEKLYGPLAQYDYADVQFRNKNTPESIFEVQHTYASTGLQVTTNIAAVCMPTRRSGTTLFDGVDIPEWGNETTTWTALRPNAYFFQSMQTEFGTDKRFAYNLAVEYNGVRFATANTRPWPGPKFWCPGMKHTLDGNNMKVFRYADAVLLMAEAYMELNDNDKAIARLNEIKARAEITLYGAFVSKDMLFEEIMKERARELFGEFNRKYDLVRWGIWYRQTYDYSDYASIQKNIMPCHEYYPIPDKEVVYSGYNLDNDEYTKYGL